MPATYYELLKNRMKSLPLSVLARILGSAPTEDFDTSVAGVSTDTRTIKNGDCFFAIAGENFDGHDYVQQAFGKGAACAVVERSVEGLGPSDEPVLRVPDTIKALGDLAREYRRMNSFKVVAVTGWVCVTAPPAVRVTVPVEVKPAVPSPVTVPMDSASASR